jgi:hypothetical protein
VLAGVDPELIVVGLRDDASPHRALTEYGVVNRDGRILRRVSAAAQGLVGQLLDGRLVAHRHTVDWDGETVELPFEGSAIAVRGGRDVITCDDEVIRCIDWESGRTQWLPLEGGRPMGSACDETAASVAFMLYEYEAETATIVTATERGGLRELATDFPYGRMFWHDPDTLVVDAGRQFVSLDVHSGEWEPLGPAPRGAAPLLDVTGRFDLELLREAARPRRVGTVGKPERARLARASRERVRRAAAELGLDEARVLRACEPAIRLRSFHPSEEIALGASRLGGRPDVPRGYAWPRFARRDDDDPMAFLAQLRCEELSAALPRAGLPSSGLLLIFAGLDGDSMAPMDPHVEIVADGQQLARAAWPTELIDVQRFSPAIAVAEPTLSLPGFEYLIEDPKYADDVPSIDDIDRFAVLARPEPPYHQVFGLPFSAQQDGVPDGYRLLLQFEQDANVGAVFGDGGRLHIWVPQDGELAGVVEGCVLDLDSY